VSTNDLVVRWLSGVSGSIQPAETTLDINKRLASLQAVTEDGVFDPPLSGHRLPFDETSIMLRFTRLNLFRLLKTDVCEDCRVSCKLLPLLISARAESPLFATSWYATVNPSAQRPWARRLFVVVDLVVSDDISESSQGHHRSSSSHGFDHQSATRQPSLNYARKRTTDVHS